VAAAAKGAAVAAEAVAAEAVAAVPVEAAVLEAAAAPVEAAAVVAVPEVARPLLPNHRDRELPVAVDHARRVPDPFRFVRICRIFRSKVLSSALCPIFAAFCSH